MATLKNEWIADDPTLVAVQIDSNNDWVSQTFTPSESYEVTTIKLLMHRDSGDNVGTVTVSLKAVDANSQPTGADLCSGTVDSTNINDTSQSFITAVWDNNANSVSFSMSPSYTLVKDTEYAIVVRASGADSTNILRLYINDQTQFADGVRDFSTDGGATWNGPFTNDIVFQVWGQSPTLSDKIYSKKLIAIGGNQVWYESSSGTMAEITAARNDIDTSNPLEAFSGYQKVFIANVSNLKILDLANIKLTTAEIGAAGISAPQKAAIISGNTSGAEAVVDFCTAATGSAEIYAYLIGSTAFVSDDIVTGGANNTVSFTLISASVTAPHWYDWTVQHNDTTNYGSMPSEAKIGCLYRGRAVLAGHRSYPHQWYMSDVGDIFRWDYRANNPLSAIRGGNADAGEIGDIIKVLIPLGDDYLIFGCANSIWQLSGDAAAGGSLNPVTQDTGIFGPKAYCFDDQKNIYFFGRNGLYKASVAAGMSTPVNISQLHLPNWIDDWALDESLHRVALTFDPIRRGIIISKTTLADGTNENYWYDLKTEGFFPEDYPTQNAIYCSHYYASTEPSYRGLLLGCKDGYIRYFSDLAKDDDIGTTSAIITSYVLLPVQQAGQLDEEGKLNSLTIELAGGASGGAFSDTDNLDMFVYTAEDAETLVEDVKDGASAILSANLSASGRKTRLRRKVRGHFLGILLQNITSNATWAVNRIYGDIEVAGKIKEGG